jgi:hypothetical protein
MHEAKRARGSTKAAASGGSKPMPAAKPAAPRHGKAPASTKLAATGGSKPPPGEVVKGRRPLSPAQRIADFSTDISVDDYLVGKLRPSSAFFLFDEVFN